MKNLLLLFAFFTMCTITSAQNNNAKKQKENITFPELMVFSDEFETFFSRKNKLKKLFRTNIGWKGRFGLRL